MSICLFYWHRFSVVLTFCLLHSRWIHQGILVDNCCWWRDAISSLVQLLLWLHKGTKEVSMSNLLHSPWDRECDRSWKNFKRIMSADQSKLPLNKAKMQATIAGTHAAKNIKTMPRGQELDFLGWWWLWDTWYWSPLLPFNCAPDNKVVWFTNQVFCGFKDWEQESAGLNRAVKFLSKGSSKGTEVFNSKILMRVMYVQFIKKELCSRRGRVPIDWNMFLFWNNLMTWLMTPIKRMNRKSGFVMLLLKKFLSYSKCKEFGHVQNGQYQGNQCWWNKWWSEVLWSRFIVLY